MIRKADETLILLSDNNTKEDFQTLKRFKRIISLLLCMSLIFVPASAVDSEDQDMTRKVSVLITDTEAIPLDGLAAYALTRSVPSDGIVLSLPVTTRITEEATSTVIDLSDTYQLTSREQQIVAADYILDPSGYSADFIASTDSDTKLELTTGLEFGVTRATPSASGEDYQERNDWSSTLSYTRKSAERYYFGNLAENNGYLYDWVQSICIQGFALEPSSISLSYSYNV